MENMNLQKRDFQLALLISFLLLLPALVWVLLDTSIITGDAAYYARFTLYQYRALRVSAGAWWHELMLTGQFKAQGISWFGQFFVPLGIRLGSIDRGLMLSILVTQGAALALMFGVVRKLGGGPVLAAFGCLALASAPLFVDAGQHYMVEPLQTLAVMWFLWIMVSSSGWSRFLTLSQLLGASTLAALAKLNSPAFSVFPAFAALFIVLRGEPSRRPFGWGDRRALITLVAVLPVSVAALFWYAHNFSTVWNFVRGASSGPVAAFWMWGKEDTFLNTFRYWVGALGRSLFVNNGLLALALILAAASLFLLLKKKEPVKSAGLFTWTMVLQILLILILFSFSPNRSIRYLLPVLPYFAVLLCILLARLQHRLLMTLFIGVFALQMGLLQAQAWGGNPGLRYPLVQPLSRSEADRHLQEWVVDFTCKNPGRSVLVVVGVETSVKSTWLSPEPLNYLVAKTRSDGRGPLPCQYTYFNNSFFGGTAGESWSHLLSSKVEYVVITDPAIYPPSLKTADAALFPENQPVLMDLLDHGGRFQRVGSLPGDPGILIYERIHKTRQTSLPVFGGE